MDIFLVANNNVGSTKQYATTKWASMPIQQSNSCVENKNGEKKTIKTTKKKNGEKETMKAKVEGEEHGLQISQSFRQNTFDSQKGIKMCDNITDTGCSHDRLNQDHTPGFNSYHTPEDSRSLHMDGT
ncbi:hypothetical protein HAX54_034126 [Datura stramonium]|uniref:Uncharacterized protein n=1 Tax=Datura stramonium TaxID=4076 RepID=A0ABS8VGJ1_DATST|nr:hypothetical protein [Datura stramonium]